MKRSSLVALALIGALGPLLVAGPAAAQSPGVTPTEVKIGNTNPYSGPASAYGTIGKALAAYFTKVNAEGGVNGRKIDFVTLDDGYSPPKTVEMVRRLVEQDQVAFVFQTLGTPTNSAIHKYLNQAKVPHLFVATGATKWGDPQHFPWTMGWQPTYQTEGHIYAQYVLRNVPNAKIGILYQNDDYGKDYVKGIKDGLGEASKNLITALYLKDPTDPQWRNDAGMKDWLVFMQKYYPDGNTKDAFNVYAYTVAQGLVHVLKQCGKDSSRENIMRQAASIKDLALPLLLPGIKVNTSPTDFYPIEQEQLAKFDGERWVLFGEVYDAGKK